MHLRYMLSSTYFDSSFEFICSDDASISNMNFHSEEPFFDCQGDIFVFFWYRGTDKTVFYNSFEVLEKDLI